MTGKDTDSVEREDSANVDLYSRQFDQHGVDVSALGWSSAKTQELRFRILASIGDLSTAAILDVGCGFGDLYQWLMKGGYGGRYTGVDITGEMVIAARQLNSGIDFHHGNILSDAIYSDGQFDYVLASGIFTYRVDSGIDFVVDVAQRMFALSSKGAGFNCLSAWGDGVDAGELTVDPDELLARCREITPWITLRHDYHPGDFTVFMYHERQESIG